jgi:SAM-dependent methyltransferase
MHPHRSLDPDSAQRPPVCDYEGSDYQDRFWDQGERTYEDRSEAAAIRKLLPRAGRNLLEVGAGAGRNSARYVGFENVVMLDYSISQLRQARQRLGEDPKYLRVVGDVYRLPFATGSFEASTMIRTFHHMAEPLMALQSLRRTLVDGASLILEFANKRNLKAILRWLFRAQSWNPFDETPVEFAELNFDFHPRAVRAWLSAAGFRVDRQLAVSYLRLPIVKRIVPTALLVALDSLLQPTGRWVQFSPSVFVGAEVVEDQSLVGSGRQYSPRSR